MSCTTRHNVLLPLLTDVEIPTGGEDEGGRGGSNIATVVAGVLVPLFILVATTTVLVIGFTKWWRRR